MSKRLRIQFPGAIYHVTSRGNRKSPTFLDDIDRRQFLKILAIVLDVLGAQCFTYCLMGNHVHLVICTPRGNISSVMHRLNTRYAKYLNRRYQWTGHVFEGPFGATLIEDSAYLRNAIAYVARNPVAAGLVKNAGDWQWSSFRASVGKCSKPSFLTLDWLPRLYEAPTIAESRRLFEEHVAKSDDLHGEENEPVQGGHAFKQRVRNLIGVTLYMADAPRNYRALARPPLSELLGGVRRHERRVAIVRAHVVHGYRMSDIARHLDLHPTTVSRIVNQTGSYRNRGQAR